MAITMDSKLGDLMEVPEAVEILDKYVPGFSSNPMLKMGLSMKLSEIVAFPQAGFSPDAIAGLTADLAALEG